MDRPRCARAHAFDAFTAGMAWAAGCAAELLAVTAGLVAAAFRKDVSSI